MFDSTQPIMEYGIKSNAERKRRRWKIGAFASLGVVIVAFGIFHVHSCNDRFNPDDDVPRHLKIGNGEGIREIGTLLEENAIISSVLSFQYCSWRMADRGPLLAGDYDIAPSRRVKEIVSQLQGGETSSRETKLTVIEGWTLAQIADEVEKKELDTKDHFVQSGQKASMFANDYPVLSGIPEDASLEGFLFPDTYFFTPNKTDSRLIARTMLENFEKKVSSDMRSDIRAQGRTLFDVMTLASMIEKEAKTEDDARMIAGVFMNRLERGMKLESDATVNYVTGKNIPQASMRDIAVDSPYNTYLYKGLPLGPICNPGLIAIEAAIHPADHDYLYFLNEQKEGKAYFARTKEEHDENRKNHLDVE